MLKDDKHSSVSVVAQAWNHLEQLLKKASTALREDEAGNASLVTDTERTDESSGAK